MVDFSSHTITGNVGTINSQLGDVALGYYASDEVVVTWVKNNNPQNGTSELDWGLNAGGIPTRLEQNSAKILTRDQAQQAMKDGAVLLIVNAEG